MQDIFDGIVEYHGHYDPTAAAKVDNSKTAASAHGSDDEKKDAEEAAYVVPALRE